MLSKKYFLVLALMACLFASVAYAEEIIINDAYTTSFMNVNGGKFTPVTEFDAPTPVLYVIDYDLVGDPDKKYRVAIVVKSCGDKIRVTERVGPGKNIVSLTTNVVREDDVGVQTVQYVVKLKERGVKGILDRDSETSEIIIVE